ncbi:uncharacterized protein LOC115560654 [Gadus morhua]|uniref:uncharacterized protein LOC115560654 n=1 Tax=Gadus morhua TaxID=8049 RepID=UPI0011B47278|nr:uncharacterized protein LOC115560654 [Gadus morhua]
MPANRSYQPQPQSCSSSQWSLSKPELSGPVDSESSFSSPQNRYLMPANWSYQPQPQSCSSSQWSLSKPELSGPVDSESSFSSPQNRYLMPANRSYLHYRPPDRQRPWDLSLEPLMTSGSSGPGSLSKSELSGPVDSESSLQFLFDSDYETHFAGQALSLTDEQLLKVAETLGKECTQAAIPLELSITDLNDIKAKHRSVATQKYKMLVLWKRRRPSGEATAQDLLRGLEAMEDLRVGTRLLLKDFASLRIPTCSSGQESRPGKLFSSLPLKRDGSECTLDSDYETHFAGQALSLTDEQLLKVAETLGKEWTQAAIPLELSITDLNDIKAKHRSVATQKYKMLVLWKRRRPSGEATAQDLLRGLEAMEDLRVGTRLLLKDFASLRIPTCSSGQESRPGKLFSSLPLKRDGSECTLDSDYETHFAGQALSLTDEQLLKVAETLGKEWTQAAIPLELSITDLNDIKAKHRSVATQKYKMLVLWKRRRPSGEATAQDLLRGLEAMEDLRVGTRLLLKDFASLRIPTCSSGQESRPGKLFSSLPLKRDGSECTLDSDYETHFAGQALSLTDEQLLKVAETLGKEWTQAAIPLELSITDLNDIKAKHRSVATQKYKMLVLWKRRRPSGEATAQDLLRGLEAMEDLRVGTRLLLKDFASLRIPTCSSGQESRPGKLFSSLPLKRDGSECTLDSDYETHFAGQALSLTDEQLLKVAETLGKEWTQAAIPLELSITDLNDIKAKHRSVATQKYKMLVLWKRRRPSGEATAQDLLRGLEAMEDLRVGTRLLLKDFASLRIPTCSSGQESRPGKLFSSLPLKRDGSECTLDSDYETHFAGQALSLTDEQLLRVAETLGKEWTQVAIKLELSIPDLDDIKAKHISVATQKYKMLVLWKRRRPSGEATAQDLLRGLEDLKELPFETRLLLKGTSLTEDTASMPVVDRCEEEDCSDSGEQSQGRKSIQSGLRSKPVKKKPSHSSGPGSRPVELSSSLHLKEPASDGTLALGDDKTLVKPKKQTRARNNETCSAGQDLSDEQLRDVAQTLGQEWERAALHLGLKKKDLDEIKKEKREFMQRRNMLRLWKDRRPGKVTAQDLLRGLEDMKDLPVETRLLLKDLLPKMESSSSGTSLTEDTASMPVVDRCEEDCSDSGEQSQGRKSSKSDASVEIDEDDEEDEEEMPVKSQREKCKAAQQSPEYVKVTPTEISKQSSNPIIPSSLPVKHHGAVLVYKGLTRECRTDHIFRVFLSLNNDSEIKAVEEQIQIGVKQWIKIEIPPLCLLEEKVYHLTSEPEGQIEPKNQPFTTAVLACKGYFVARFSEHPPFRLFLMDSDSDEPLWSATIREEDWTCEKSSLPKMNQVPNNRGRGEQSQGRKSSQSGTSLTEDTASMPVVDRCGEEDCSDSGEQSQGRKSIQSGLRSKPVKKKPSHSSRPGSRPVELSSSLPLKKPASDGTLALGDDKTLVKPKKQTRARNNETCSAGQDLSDEQLRDVAQTLGQEWERAALHLGLKKKDLDEIKKEKREFMQRRNMLRLWKDRRPGKVTAQDLLRGLEDMKDLPVETRLLLKDLLPKMESSSSGTSLTEDTASMPVVDRCEEDCSDSGEQSQGRKSSKSDASVEIDEDDEEDEEEMPVKSQREKCKAAQQSPEYVKVTPTEISKQSSNPIIPSSLPVKHHGAVLVYKGLTRECRTDHIFRVFLSLNNDSEIKAVEEQIQIGVKQWIKIEIPPLCLLEEKVYHLTSEPEGQIEPKNQPFTTAVLACKGYFVARFSEHPPFRLFLMDSDSDEPLWSATIREEDWTCEKSSLPKMNQVPNNRGRGEQSQGRKSSQSGEQSQGRKSSQSGLRSKPVKKPSHSSRPGSRPVELSSSLHLKKPASDGTLALGDDKTLVKPKKQTRARNNETCSAGQDLSDKQLRDVAQTLGQEWEQAALHLGLKKEDLDEIKKEKREFMQRRNMLVQWKRRRPGKVTAQDLLRGLEDMKNLPVETRLLLKDLLPKMESSSSGTSLTEDTASMPVVDRCEEDCSDSGEQSQGRKSSKSDASAEIAEDDEEEMHVKSQREKCKAAQQSPDYVKVTPTEISKQSSNPIIPSSRPVQHEGAVLVYKELKRQCRTDHIFRVFLSLNTIPETEAVEEQIQTGDKQWIKIDISARCLLEEKVYHLTSEPEGHIENNDQKFTTAVLASKGFFVVRFSALERPPFKLSLMDSDCDEPLWSATIREEDCKGKKSSLPKMNQEANNRGRGEQSQGRKSSHSGTSLTEDIASMFLTDRHEEEDCSDSDASAEIDEEVEGTSLTEDIASMSVVDRCEEDCSDSDASAEIDEDDEEDEEEMHVKSQHEKCKAAHQSPEYVKVTPTEISKRRFKLPLKGKGTYECSATGLVFEVSEQAVVRYSVLSWIEFAKFLHDSWRPAGSIWKVDVVNNDSSVLKFIHFPHSLCLSGPEHELIFSVLLVKGSHDSIESTVDFTASHVKWPVSSPCRVGPIIPSSLPVKHDGAVLVYKELTRKCRKDHILRVFLSLNNESGIKAVEEQLLKTGKEWIEIDLTQGCNLEEKVYHLTSEPEGQIEHKNQKFTTAVLASKGFFVVRFSALERPPFKLSLMESDCDEPLWSATIREEDCKGKKSSLLKMNQVANNRGRGEQSQGRKSSQSEEILRIRSKFVQRVTIQVLKGLLDDLYEREVVSLEEKDSLMEEWRSKADRARCLADMVIGKGEEASQKMIDSMKERDKHLCSTLGLFSSPSAAVAEL